MDPTEEGDLADRDVAYRTNSKPPLTAMVLLARPDTAPELRIRTRRRLIGHYALRGDWPAVEDQSRAGLAEVQGDPEFQWSLIAATYNQGRLDRAQELFDQFRPEISNIGQAGLWMSLRIQNGFSLEDVNTALDLLDRWPRDSSFETQVMSAFLGAAGRRAPGGELILPELDPQTLQRFQERLNNYRLRHPDGPIRSINFDAHDFADMLRAQLAPQAEAIEAVERLVREGRISLGALAALLGRSYAKALIQRSPGVILAVTPDLSAFEMELNAARVAIDKAVVIHSSAVAVASVLPGRWPQLRGVFRELMFPRDSWTDFQTARFDLLRDPESTYSVGYDISRQALVGHQLTDAEQAFLTRRVGEIDKALHDVRVVASPELGAFADYSPAPTDPSISPLALAEEADAPLWCDDVVLRVLAHEHSIAVFGTLALLDVLIESDRLPDTLRDDAIEMARQYVVDLTLSPEELLSLAAETNYEPGPTATIIARPVFWADPSAARDVVLHLMAAINAAAPRTIPTWLRAACFGLASRQPEDAMNNVPSLASAVSAYIKADQDLDTLLMGVARAVVDEFNARQGGADGHRTDDASDPDVSGGH